MKKSDDLLAADNYREQLQERSHKGFKITPQLLADACEHVRKVFPGAFEDEKLPFEILSKFLIENNINEITLKEAEELILANLEDKSDPLNSIVNSDKSSQFDCMLTSEVSESYIKDLIVACEKLNIPIRGGVSGGLIDTNELQAEQQSVFLTESSIINVSTNLYILVHRVSKLIAKSLAFGFVENDKYQLSNNIDDYIKILMNDSSLQKEWDLFFTDCAYDLKSPLLGKTVVVNGSHVQNCFTDIKDAIMLFIVGHELGHHICEHSLDGSSHSNSEKAFEMEHEADLVSSKLGMYVGNNLNYFNLFAATNIGPLLILTILDLIHEGQHIVKYGNEETTKTSNGTHPPIKDRLGFIDAFLGTSEYTDESKNLIFKLWNLFDELLKFIWGNTRNNLLRMHEAGCRPKENHEISWLP